MKILLLNPPLFDATKYGKPPLLGTAPAVGLGYIAAVLEKASYEVTISDLYFSTWFEAKEILEKAAPDIVGITCLSEGRINAFKLAQLAKSVNPHTIVVMGGQHVTYLYEQVLKNFPVDVVVLGEGEITFLKLVKAIEKSKPLEEVSGLAFEKNGHIIKTADREPIADLDSIPFPLHRFSKFDAYPPITRNDPWIAEETLDCKKIKDLRYVTMVTSRGCPYNCQFCSSTAFWGRKWRFRSAENVLDEIELLYNKFDCRYFNFADDAFTVKPERTIEICKGILERNLRIVWDCTTRVNFVTEEMVRWLKRAGCRRICLGIESGSPLILKTIDKKITIDQIIDAFSSCHKVGIPAGALVMVGNPGESDRTIAETYHVLKRIKPFHTSISLTMVFPGTRLCELAKEKGLIDDDFWLTELPPPYYTAEHNLEQLKKWCSSLDRINKSTPMRLICTFRDWLDTKTGIRLTRKGVTRAKRPVYEYHNKNMSG